ncbi:MAG: DUF3592 domain-containing protein [bacterium]
MGLGWGRGGTPLGQLIVGFILVAVIVFGAWVLVRERQRADASTHWPSVPGAIVTSELRAPAEGSSDDNYYVKVEYEYVVAGAHYTSEKLQFGGSNAFHDHDSAAAFQDRYPDGDPVTAFYDPAQPSLSVLIPGTGAMGITFLAIAAGLGLFGIWAMLTFVSGFLRLARGEAPLSRPH